MCRPASIRSMWRCVRKCFHRLNVHHSKDPLLSYTVFFSLGTGGGGANPVLHGLLDFEISEENL